MYPGFPYCAARRTGRRRCIQNTLNIILLFCQLVYYYTPTGLSRNRTLKAIHIFHVLFYEFSVQNIFQ
jgi:hypothetical protein